MTLERAKVEIDHVPESALMQSVLIVQIETQLGERTGCRLSTDNARRIFLEARRMRTDARVRMLKDLQQVLKDTPTRDWSWDGGEQTALAQEGEAA